MRTARMAFLTCRSLFLNFFMFSCTEGSDSFEAYVVIQGWFIMSSDLIRFSFSMVNSCWTKSLP